MGYPGRHSDADDVAVTSPGKSFEERFEKLEKMHQAQNAQLERKDPRNNSHTLHTCLVQ